MTEIRCDSATLHIYSKGYATASDPQIGERQVFDGDELASWPGPTEATQMYAALWKNGQLVTCTEPL